MKKTLITILLMAINMAVFAQESPMHDKMHERLESHKVAFITEKVDLSPDEAKKFWPVYDEFQEKERALRKEMRPEKRVDELTEEAAEELVKIHLKKSKELVELREQYTMRFLDILPATKVVLLHRAENEFKREMLRRIRERMDNRRMDRDKRRQ